MSTKSNGRNFHLAVILSCMSPLTLCNLMEIQIFLNYLDPEGKIDAGTPQKTAQACVRKIIPQLPFLEGIDFTKVNSENWKAWLQAQIEEHGMWHTIRPIS